MPDKTNREKQESTSFHTKLLIDLSGFAVGASLYLLRRSTNTEDFRERVQKQLDEIEKKQATDKTIQQNTVSANSKTGQKIVLDKTDRQRLQVVSGKKLRAYRNLEKQYWLYSTGAILAVSAFLFGVRMLNIHFLRISSSNSVEFGLFLILTVIACSGIIRGIISLWKSRLEKTREAIRQETYEQNREFFDALEEDIYRSLKRGI